MRNLRGDGAYPRQYQAFAEFHLRVRQSGLFRREKKFPRRPLYPARAVRDAVYGLQRGQLQQHVRPRGQRLYQARSEGPFAFGGQLPRGGGELFNDHQRRPRANPRGGRPRVLHRQSGRADRQYRHAGQLVHVPRHRGKAERRGAYVYDRRAGERRPDGRKYRR